jgi:hypothetical protein
MNDKSNITPIAPMTMQRQAHVSQNGIGAAFGHLVHCGWHINQPGNGAYRDAVIHGNYYRSVSLAIQDAFQPDRLSYPAHGEKHVDTKIKDDGRAGSHFPRDSGFLARCPGPRQKAELWTLADWNLGFPFTQPQAFISLDAISLTGIT